MEVSRTACKFGFRWNFASHGSWVRRLFYFQKNKSAALANSYAAGFAVGWISTFLVRSRELFAPKMSEIGLCRLRMSRSFLQGLCRAVSRMSRGAIAGNHQQHFFDPIGSNMIGDRIEKNVIFSIRSGIVIVLGRLLCDLIPSFWFLLFDLKKRWACLCSPILQNPTG